MKVLIFTTQFYLLGGAEKLAIELAEGLNRRGVQADILSMYGEELPNVKQLKKELFQKGIPNIYFLGMNIHPSVKSFISAVKKVKRFINVNNYDIVETSQLTPTVICSWATKFNKTKHIAGIHQVFKRERDNSLQYLFWRFTALINSHTRYYAISDYVAKFWLQYSLVKNERIRRIYNGICDEFFNAKSERKAICEELKISKDSKIVLFVGRIAAYKGIDIVFQALLPILKATNVNLVFIGHEDLAVPGTIEILTKIQNDIITEKIENKIHFLGRREDIPKFMASCDLLVHPARIEGFGLVLAEAMAAGLPIVATNVEGIPEVLSSSDSIIIPPDDPEIVRKSVLQVFNWTSTERNNVIEKGKIRAEDFRMNNRILNLIILYSDIINGKF